MATINYTTEVGLASRYIKVQWSGLAAGDDGQPFDCSGLEVKSIQTWGGTLALDASNEPTPTNFREVFSGSDPFMPPLSGNSLPPFVGTIRPRVTSGSGIGLAVLFTLP